MITGDGEHEGTRVTWDDSDDLLIPETEKTSSSSTVATQTDNKDEKQTKPVVAIDAEKLEMYGDDSDDEYMETPDTPYDLDAHANGGHDDDNDAAGEKPRFRKPRMSATIVYSTGKVISLVYRETPESSAKRGYARIVRIHGTPMTLNDHTKVDITWLYKFDDVEKMLVDAGRGDDLEEYSISPYSYLESDHKDTIEYWQILCAKRKPFVGKHLVKLPTVEAGELVIESISAVQNTEAGSAAADRKQTHRLELTVEESQYHDFLCANTNDEKALCHATEFGRLVTTRIKSLLSINTGLSQEALDSTIDTFWKQLYLDDFDETLVRKQPPECVSCSACSRKQKIGILVGSFRKLYFHDLCFARWKRILDLMQCMREHLDAYRKDGNAFATFCKRGVLADYPRVRSLLFDGAEQPKPTRASKRHTSASASGSTATSSSS